MPRIITLGFLLLALTACGNRTTTEPSVGASIWQRIKTIGQAPQPAAPAPAPLTRATFANVSVPVILVTVPSRNAIASLGLARENAATRTYVAADGISLALQSGLLVATRGFGDDMMSADHGETLAHILAGAGSHTRVLRFLDDQDQLQAMTLSCTLTPQGVQDIAILEKSQRVTAFNETCSGGPTPITNVFMVADGTLVKSSQWVSPRIGPIIIEQIQ